MRAARRRSAGEALGPLDALGAPQQAVDLVDGQDLRQARPRFGAETAAVGSAGA